MFQFWSCSDKEKLSDKKQLTGRYIFRAYKDTVDVNSDGTFTRYSDNKQLPGTWTYDSITGNLKLKNFWYPTGDWHTKVRQRNNEIHFIYATDISDGYYLRIDSVDRGEQD
jgi:hypothetical protein